MHDKTHRAEIIILYISSNLLVAINDFKETFLTLSEYVLLLQ